jgi:hypothetical protein
MLTEPALASLFPWYMRLRNKNVASVCFTQNDHEDLTGTAALDMCVAVGRQLGMTLALTPTVDGSQLPANNRTVLPLVQSDRPRCGDPAVSASGT